MRLNQLLMPGWIRTLVILAMTGLAPAAALGQNYSDFWYDKSEGGWGLSLADHGDLIAGRWFTYDSRGAPVWYFFPAVPASENRRIVESDLFAPYARAEGGKVNPDNVFPYRIGRIRIDFAPPDQPEGTALYTVQSSRSDVPSITRLIRRYPFGTGAADWPRDSSDLWLDAAATQEGLALAQHGREIFGIRQSYDAAGAPRWAAISGTLTESGSGFTAGLFAMTGPEYGSSYFDSSKIRAVRIGEATFSRNGEGAILQTIINGTSSARALNPISFGTDLLAINCVTNATSDRPAVLTADLVDRAALKWIVPLGNLNPPQHPTPTDHIYFYIADPDGGETPQGKRTTVYAPGDGVVSWLNTGSGPEADSTMMVKIDAKLTYYLSHIIPDAGIGVGTRLAAGQRIGTSGNAFAVDLGMMNSDITHYFANPSRYPAGNTLNGDAPLKYYAEPLRSQLYLKVQRIGPDCDGSFARDKAGTLAGNWFFGAGPNPLALSFTRDTYNGDQTRVTVPTGFNFNIGGGVSRIGPDDPRPENVSVATGKVLYTLTTARTGLPTGGYQYGRMLIQLIDDTHVKMELFRNDQDASDFTARAVFGGR